METSGDRIKIQLPRGTKMTRISNIKSTNRSQEIKTEFCIGNICGEDVFVSPNLKFNANGKILWLCDKPDKTDVKMYDVTLKESVKYYNDVVPDGTLAYDTPATLSFGSSVILPTGSKVYMDFNTITGVILTDNVTAIII